MKKLALPILSMLLFVITSSTFAQNRTEVVGQSYAKDVCPTCVVPDKDVEAPKPDPSRGECCLNFDNYTGYWINVWVDGTYRGQVAPWDDDYVCVYEGWTSWYAETAGETYYWQGSGDCRGWYDLKLK